MHVLADASMPLVNELADALTAQGVGLTLTTFQGRQPQPELLAQADALMIRSITKVDSQLLAQAPKLRWLGTATIGTEHVDTAACKAAGVAFVSTPGVNANAVGDYVASAVSNFALQCQQLPSGEVAIIGAGHTGRAAGQRLSGLGFIVHYYDPPLAEQGVKGVHADWQRVLNSGVISCHVPLTQAGTHATYHLFDSAAIAALPADCLLINASRGAVVEEQGLRQAMQAQQPLHVVLDVWEHEPTIAADLMPWLLYATPHIAGHSVAGKVAGTLRLFEHVCETLLITQQRVRLPQLSQLLEHWPEATRKRQWQTLQAPTWQMLASWVRDIYDIRNDDQLLRQNAFTEADFDRLRRNYAARAELSCGEVHGNDWLAQSEWQERLAQLTFLFKFIQEQ